VRVLAVNVSSARNVPWRGRSVATGIFKEPIAGSVRVETLGIAGDVQADLAVHGGTNKAVYAYPAEHYPFWRSEYPDMELGWGMFGENLTTEGLLETQVRIGDRLRIGTATATVTQPRFPCFKLGIKFGRKDVIERFRRSRRSGFYLAVSQPGDVAAGDPIELLHEAAGQPTVAEIVRARADGDEGNAAWAMRAVAEVTVRSP
jgi:MOSC domain-containing protein YiiM